MRSNTTTAGAITSLAFVASLATTSCQGTVDTPPPETAAASAAGSPPPAEGANQASAVGNDDDTKAATYVRSFHTSDAPPDWLKAHPLSLEESRALRAYSKKLLKSGDERLLQAGRSAALAAAVNLASNQQLDASLDAWLDAIQVEFMMASTGPQYDEVRSEALSSVPKAEQVADQDLRARFLIVAADTSRFKFVTARGDKGGKLTPEEVATLATMADDFGQAVDALNGLRPDNAEWAVRAREMVVLIARDLDELAPDPTAKKFLLRLAPVLEKLNGNPGGHDRSEDSRNARTDMLLANLMYSVGKPDLGRSRMAALIGDSNAAASHPAAWVEGMGQFYRTERDRGVSSEALAPVRQELASNDARVRGEYRSRLGRLMISAALAKAYSRMLADEVFSLPTVPEAFAAIERDKARSLLDDIQLGASKIPAALAAQEDQVRRAMQTFEANEQLQDDLLEGLQIVSLVPLRLDHGEPDALERVEAAYAAAGVGFPSVGTTTKAGDVQGMLGPDEAFVDYHILQSDAGSAIGLAAAVLTRTSAKLVLRAFKQPKNALNAKIFISGMQPIDSGPLMAAVADARGALANGVATNKQLTELYSLLVSPVLATIPPGMRRLIVSPDGVLNLVSFPALRSDSGRFLIQDFAISTVESASIWIAEKRRALPAPARVLGIFAPMNGSGASSGLSLRTEAYPLDGAADGRFWAPEGSTATDSKATILAALGGGGAVHVSGHGVLSSAVADHQTIILSAGTSPESALDAYEVRQIASPRWNVATLGICDGGVMRYGSGNEPYGLVPAFQTAGAQDVVAPMWKVNQAADRKFFRTFYGALATADPSAAYQMSANAFIKEGLSPRDWAGYAVFGP